MRRFVKPPHLPQGKAELVLIGEKYRERLEKPLKKLGIECLWLPDNPHVDKRLSGHVDLSVVHLGENKLILAEYLRGQSIVNTLTNRGFSIKYSTKVQSRLYPNDCGLNICIVGSSVICNPETIDNEIKKYFEKLRQIHVNQGYTKCSVCITDNNSLITTDEGIATAASAARVETLLIQNSGVNLDGFNSGFIGGATFKISEKKLAVTGRLDKCSDKDLVYKYAAQKGIDIIYLTEDQAFDIGSGVILVENSI